MAAGRRERSGPAGPRTNSSSPSRVGADDSWPESREKLLKAWNRRREIFFRSCKIASIAKQRQVEVREDDHCFAPNHHYFNAGRFANPLSAVDAGISFGRA